MFHLAIISLTNLISEWCTFFECYLRINYYICSGSSNCYICLRKARLQYEGIEFNLFIFFGKIIYHNPLSCPKFWQLSFTFVFVVVWVLSWASPLVFQISFNPHNLRQHLSFFLQYYFLPDHLLILSFFTYSSLSKSHKYLLWCQEAFVHTYCSDFDPIFLQKIKISNL